MAEHGIYQPDPNDPHCLALRLVDRGAECRFDRELPARPLEGVLFLFGPQGNPGDVDIPGAISCRWYWTNLLTQKSEINVATCLAMSFIVFYCTYHVSCWKQP